MHPTLYQVSARLLLNELGRRLGRKALLSDIDDEHLDLLAVRGFDWVYLLGVWQTGPAGRRVSQTLPANVNSYAEKLPGWTPDDVCGSPFAVRSYVVHEDFGGDAALAQLRDRLQRRGVKLMLDFVPNHTAIDHAWVDEHPEYYVPGTQDDAAREPQNFVETAGIGGCRVLAHGRDPYFPGWADTLQLNYRSAAFREAMIEQLRKIAGQCDGLRCDMAMLVLPQIFRRTWGDRALPVDGTPPVDAPFWPEAIGAVHGDRPDFTFMAEAYWETEAELQLQGFAYTYDKLLYDRLRAGEVEAAREHLAGDYGFQCRSVRFLENHDEPRAAAVFDHDKHQAAAVAAFTVPGLRFFHDGQLDGRRYAPSIHLSRRADEGADPVLRGFYISLLQCLDRSVFENGTWRLLARRAAWAENPTWKNFFTYEWRDGERRTWVVVNFGPTYGQCYVEVPGDELRGRTFMLRDQLSRAWYERDGNDLAARGLYVDMPAWGYHIFDVTPS